MWGISSFTYGWNVGFSGHWPEKPWKEVDLLQKAVDFGAPLLQIGDNLPVHRLTREQLTHLRDQSREMRVGLEIGARGLTEAHLAQYIELAAFLDARLLRFITDGPDGYEPTVDEVVGILRNALPTLHRYNLRLGIENHDRLRARELAEIVSKIDDERVGICLDCANSLGAGEGIDVVADVLLPYTVNLHLKDFTIRRLPYKMGFTVEGAPLGQGMLQVNDLLHRVSGLSRPPTIILELWTPPADTPANTLLRETAWAAESVDFFKRLVFADFF